MRIDKRLWAARFKTRSRASRACEMGRIQCHGRAIESGHTIKINGHQFTIVGVAPRGFIGTTLMNFIPDVWVPVTMQQTIAPNERQLHGGARQSLDQPAQPAEALRDAGTGPNLSLGHNSPPLLLIAG